MPQSLTAPFVSRGHLDYRYHNLTERSSMAVQQPATSTQHPTKATSLKVQKVKKVKKSKKSKVSMLLSDQSQTGTYTNRYLPVSLQTPFSSLSVLVVQLYYVLLPPLGPTLVHRAPPSPLNSSSHNTTLAVCSLNTWVEHHIFTIFPLCFMCLPPLKPRFYHGCSFQARTPSWPFPPHRVNHVNNDSISSRV